MALTTALFLLFLTLKLTGYIAWSWFWVASPLIFPVVLMLMFTGTIVTAAIVGAGRITVTNRKYLRTR